jgi:hypothetical protein
VSGKQLAQRSCRRQRIDGAHPADKREQDERLVERQVEFAAATGVPAALEAV